MRPVHALHIDDAELWAATAGGVLRVHGATRSVSRFTYLDGLARGEVLAVTRDEAGDLWFGTDGGGLSRYRTESGRFDAPLTAFIDIRVGALTVADGTLYVGSDRGINVLPLDLLRVRESYRQLGSFTRDAKVSGILVHGGEIWAATSEGVARAPLASANLQDPDSWSASEIGAVTDLLLIEGEVWAAGKLGVWRHDGTQWVVEGSPLGAAQLVKVPQGVLVTNENRVYELQGARWRRSRAAQGGTIHDLVWFTGRLWAATDLGLEVLDEGILDVGDPPADQYYDLTVADGRLWAASVPNDRVGVARGVFELDGDSWQVHDRAAGLETNLAVSVAVDGTTKEMWVGTWGWGVAWRSRFGRWTWLDERNSALRGIVQPVAPAFVVVPDLAVDADGYVWATNLQVGLVVFHSQPVLRSTSFDAEHLGLGPAPELGPLAVDADGLKWIGTGRQGLVLFDDGGTPLDAQDDAAEILDSNREPLLTSNRITAVATHERTLWVGTDNGLHRIAYRHDRGTGLQIDSWRSYRLEHGLESASITDIAIDDQGGAWVGTEEGVTQFRATGALLHTYTAANSGLANDGVTSVAFDESSGALWIGTTAGLSQLQITRGDEPGATPSTLVYPNPFDPRPGASLIFAGLPLNADVRLFGVDGALVATVTAGPGGTATWDGRVSGGQQAASGVYYYVASSPAGRLRGTFAVVEGGSR